MIFSNSLLRLLVLLLFVSSGLVACSSSGIHLTDPSKRVIETSYRAKAEPSWLRDTRISWEEGEYRMVRGSYVIPGNNRINGCFDLARAETKEALITELANEIRGEFVRASQGLGEALDENVTKSWIEKFQGDTRGLRFTEQAHERFVVNDVERVECFVLAKIKNSDYLAIRTRLYSNIVRTDDRVRKAMEERQIHLLNEGASEKEPKKQADPAST